MDLLNTLQSIGFTQDEAKVYLSCIELGISPVRNIARISQIKRTTLYTILEKMNNKGYLLKSINENIIYYEAVDIHILYKNFQQNLFQLQESFKEFEKLKNSHNKKYKVSFFEGIENVAKMYQIEVNDAPENVEIFSSNYDRKKGDLDKLRKLRNIIYKSQKKAPLKKILLNRPLSKSESGWHKIEGKTIAKDLLDIPITIKIYGDKVQFISMKSPISGILIEDDEIAKTMSNIFRYIFKLQ